MSEAKERIVVIGNGMVGYKFCERLISKDTNKRFQIVTFCEEPRPAYDRVHLSEYFAGKTAEDLSMAKLEWYQQNEIELYIGEQATHIDREGKRVITATGKVVTYDKLVLATGSSAFVPPVPGIDKEGVFVYRTIEDLDAIKAYAEKSKTCAVIGGGLLGLEAAKAAQDLGLKTHVVEFAPRLMPRQLDNAGGNLLKDIIEDRGIEVHLSKATKNIAGKDRVREMEFADDSSLGVDMIIVSAGIRPRDELAREAGLKVGERGGIEVDSYLLTSDPNIFAIGECALYGGMIYGLVAPGYQMADAVSDLLTGKDASFEGADMSTKLKLIGTDVASFGSIEAPEGSGARDIVINDPHAKLYKKLVISNDGKKLLGGILVGDASAYGSLLQMYQNEIVLPPEPIQLILPASDGAPVGMGPTDLPDSAQICSCEAVTKGQICSAIEGGCSSVGELKACTKAGTGCGGCVPLLTDLFKAKMKESGVEVSNNLCEHFAHSRTDLYQIVRATGITTFDELISKHGNGKLGCETCKPAVGSILASVHNDPILNHTPLQDTNDAFLANIQQDGTYSIIPRIPGGEITPEKLIVIGQVAQKYKLYMKLTGGQRIDLLGARVHQLPLIWKELVDAGFESGHAYGKALRTVKSCVGSTWCRFGVQDSTTLAIDIEKRYRGIRSPHKIKSAVSGCARECAEARSKDFGIIATEKGWNLYVCGNGGMNPRHADLFATDIDRETLIKYIDRFLMYYIKTADKLERTSTWMTKLEGGLQHLQDVVIHDSLGIATELESQMQHLINTYECEWKNAIDDPEKLKRFKAFSNTEDTDETVKFVDVRGQICPARLNEATEQEPVNA
ncbi:assimilatory nitrite reductase (NAD(P)H) large subunit precursor [Rubritalea squalenifaciens DSM 18772]|uniref:Assimilatory nitrite reductase (NAD(P)H) large subunit n=1 Tax=Rubritalea squalenifaciens DSM 18772 TaxID=1123071 RepID=A0A1M6NT22_9BACT|nr:nitrite reductase large subunit NirB [Rubritalea squalenifaciens]SHJ98810.1 assimilatory nitrite reductase (NAD(P)H) large subunit precursor [Rubritalea squalenifaciens DSM 18772]